MVEFLIDTNVFARIFTSDAQVKQFVETLVPSPAAVDTTIYVECLQGREKRIVEDCPLHSRTCFFAPEARRRLAGGATTGTAALQIPQP